ncbi:hypothetical protein RhiJN_11969 [Ceratobasidium sp. AG-Ba]|nr:hypothetical protein RhiJN_11969 [Ceratobasidium sp. AG-Ba]
MSSFITRFLANMTMKDSKNTTQASESRPRRHERSSKHHHHHHRSRHDYYRSSYVYDSDSETDDEPPSENSLMLTWAQIIRPRRCRRSAFPHRSCEARQYCSTAATSTRVQNTSRSLSPRGPQPTTQT